MKGFGPADAAFRRALRDVLGSDNVLEDPADCWPYGYDNSRRQARPEAVGFATEAGQVRDVVRLCNEAHVPLVARGRGTGTTGAAVPVAGGLVLSLERMDRILELAPDDRLIVVEPGAINRAVQEAAATAGFFWPPDPSSADYCTVGGNLAHNSAGPRAVKYGTPRENTLGLRAVTGAGEPIRAGVRTTKGVVGYDLTRLIIGSEGTLAVITEITLRLLPRPKLQTDLLIPFPSIAAASQAAGAIVDQRILPATMEFMEQKALRAAEEFLKKRAPFREAEAHLLIQLDGDRAEDLRSQYERIGEIVSGHEAIDVLVAEDRPSQERLWEMRRALSEALTQKSPVREREDVVVPKSRIPELFERMSLLSKKHETEIVSFGHIGDGNVHVNILKEKINDKAWQDTLPVLLRELFQIVVSLGGTVSGEHGIGYVKKEFLPLAVDNPALEMMKAVKRAWDPDEILNPGKIFP